MTQGRTDLEPSQSTPVGEPQEGEGEGRLGGRPGHRPPPQSRAGKGRKRSPLFNIVKPVPLRVTARRTSGQGGARTFTQAIKRPLLVFQIESRANRFLQAGRQKKGEAWRCLETQVQGGQGLCDLSHGCRNPRPGPPWPGFPRMPFVTSQVLTGVGVEGWGYRIPLGISSKMV